MKKYKIAAILLIIHGVLSGATLVLILIQYFEKANLVKD